MWLRLTQHVYRPVVICRFFTRVRKRGSASGSSLCNWGRKTGSVAVLQSQLLSVPDGLSALLSLSGVAGEWARARPRPRERDEPGIVPWRWSETAPRCHIETRPGMSRPLDEMTGALWFGESMLTRAARSSDHALGTTYHTGHGRARRAYPSGTTGPERPPVDTTPGTFMIRSRMAKNCLGGRGLVKKSAMLLTVETNGTRMR